MDSYDLVVVGGGSGGVRCARMAAAMGAEVALVEQGRLGGTCVNIGCVPKKLFVHAAHFADAFTDARGFGWSARRPAFSWSKLLEAKDAEIARLNGIYERLVESPGAEIVRGRAQLLDAHRVKVEGRELRAEHVLLCTGARPFVPEIPGAELMRVSDDMFELEQLPARALVLGGGYIGVEFAGIMAGLGVEVSLVHRRPALLNQDFDRDVREALTTCLVGRGIDVRVNRTLLHVERAKGGLLAVLDDHQELEVDLVLCAAGRVPNSGGLGLEAAGVRTNRWGAIQVDERYRSSAPSVRAVGDVIGRFQLTPVALAEGMFVARDLFAPEPPHPLDYDNIPTAVFSQPPVGTVGQTERQARASHANVQVYRSAFRPLMHTLSGRAERTMMKMLVDGDSDRVLGCHMVGPAAGEIIQGMAVALKCGATKAQVDSTLGIHPTSAEEFVTMRTPVGA